MNPSDRTEGTPTLSVVIPSFNSAPWLPSTLDALDIAIAAAGISAEVIVVDDGSTDATAEVVTEAAKRFSGGVQLVQQSNRGRFLARWTGLEHAHAPSVLLLDSRVLLAPRSLAHVFETMTVDPTATVWNAHTLTDPDAPLVGRFWEVPTYVFWGSYLRSPRPYDLTIDNFDRAPKGTTAFLAPRSVLIDAFEHAWPEADARLVSDDTKIIRRIAERTPIRLDPGFAATYRPRTTVSGFLRHSLDRGTLFVDSYAGTTGLRSVIIIILAIAPLLAVAAFIALVAAGAVAAALLILGLAVILVLSPIVPAVVNRCPPRGVAAYVVCLPLFVIPFWAGLVRGAFIHRRAFFGAGANTDQERPLA